jgi:hypothetical protein
MDLVETILTPNPYDFTVIHFHPQIHYLNL